MGADPKRRELSFRKFDGVLGELERLAGGKVQTTGDHDFVEIPNHLSPSLSVSPRQKRPPAVPFFMKLMTPVLKWMTIHSKPLEPGVKILAQAKSFFGPDKSLGIQEAFEEFRKSVEPYKTAGSLAIHPFFGKVASQQCDDLQRRHAAVHPSFVPPSR